MSVVLQRPLSQGAAREPSWQLLIEDRPTASEQMAFDVRLAEQGQPSLRLFRWHRPAFSTGFRQRRPEWLTAEICAAAAVELVERPTGGGLALHGSDLSCSVVLPWSLGIGLRSAMARICGAVARACATWTPGVTWADEPAGSGPIAYCLVEPSSYALLAGRRKLGGFAIRRYPGAWLIQGSLLIRPIPAALLDLMPEEVRGAYAKRAISLEKAAGQLIDDQGLIQRIAATWSISQTAERPEQVTDERNKNRRLFSHTAHLTPLTYAGH